MVTSAYGVPKAGLMSARIRIGTSGWEYRDWKGRFYPADLPKDRWLEFYAERFDCVELNASFYRLPAEEVFAGWRRRTPGGFAFAVKASRYLTHVRRLRDPAEPLDRLWSRARALEDRLGPVLYQLPPRWRPDADRLASFLAALPAAAQVLEIRDGRWYRPDIRAMVEEAGVAMCLHDMPGSSPPARRIGPFVYVRLHGAGARYAGRYSSQRLSAWAERMVGWASDGWPVWAFFNNDIGGQAVIDANRLRAMVERRLG